MIGVLVVAGCANQNMESGADASKPVPFRVLGQSATTEDKPSDETIGREVRRRLNLVGVAQTSGVIVAVDDRTVTLRGVALTQDSIWKSQAAAASVPGVKKVINQILLGGAPSVP